VHYKGHFIPKQEPEKLYLVMDTAKGTPLRDTNLSKTDRDKVQKSVNAYNKLLKENLGFVLGDRNQGNLFVQLDEQGQLKLDEAGEPMIQHIDYGIIDWY
jgi:predicted unusual protein kinase regulating ubiquinone biosynthesis (AarF/ABC1/UbiB family)